MPCATWLKHTWLVVWADVRSTVGRQLDGAIPTRPLLALSASLDAFLYREISGE